MNDIARLKDRIDSNLNDYLCEMKEGHDDSIVGFNEAWDIVRKAFAEFTPAALPAQAAGEATEDMIDTALLKRHGATTYAFLSAKGDPGHEARWSDRRRRIAETLNIALTHNSPPPSPSGAVYQIGDQVEKFTGDYHLPGEIRMAGTTKSGKMRYVVEHDPGFLHIYNENNLRRIDAKEPVLWRNRHKPGRAQLCCAGWRAMMARAAAVLIAVVMAMMLAEGVGLVAIIPMAKNQPSGNAKSVVIFDAAPDVDKSLFRPKMGGAFLRERSHSPLHFYFWEQQNVPSFEGDRLKFVFLVIHEPSYLHSIADVPGRQIAKVSNFDMGDNCFVEHFIDSPRLHAHIGSLEDFGVANLAFGRLLSGPPQQHSSYDKGDGSGGNSPREYHQPPIGRRLLLAALGLLGCFLCALKYANNKGRIYRAAWLAAALTCGLLGMGLWWATGFRETWGWPI